MIYDYYDEFGKNNINATRSDFINTIGEGGIKDIIRKVFIGGNVRDTTEFITQRRLLSSYAATYELYIKYLHDDAESLDNLIGKISNEYNQARSTQEKTFYLWMIGLTRKGFDNIVRSSENFEGYQRSFLQSITETVEDIKAHFGDLSGTIKLSDKEIDIDWAFILLLSLCLGSQTLSIRGSSKSMNGKLFEKLLLGSLLTIMGFKYLKEPPTKQLSTSEKLFWLSNMDENERETDATLIYNGIAISIDIGFIGRGNPEISLDKVTRFNRYKQIAGIGHTMKTIIIVDTVADNSDLFNKAKRVDGIVLQMRNPDWTISFAKEVCNIFSFEHPLSTKTEIELDDYFKSVMHGVPINDFIL